MPKRKKYDVRDFASEEKHLTPEMLALRRVRNAKDRQEAKRLIKAAADTPLNLSDPFWYGRTLCHYDNGHFDIQHVRAGEFQ